MELSIIFFGTAKQDYIIKTTEMFGFLLLINNSVTIGLWFFLLSISGIISSNTVNDLRFSYGLYSSIYKYYPYHLSIQKSFWIIKMI